MLNTTELNRFINDLRLAGYNIGTEQFLAVQKLLASLAAQNRLPERLGELKLLLGPVLCHTAQEQADFEQHFADWVAQVEGVSPEVEESPQADPELEQITRSNRWWQWGLLGITLAIFVGLGVYYWYPATTPATQLAAEPTAQATEQPDVQPEAQLPEAVAPVVPEATDADTNRSLSYLWLLALPPVLWLLWRYWLMYRLRRYLTRRTVNYEPELTKLYLQNLKIPLFQSAAFVRAAHQLRLHEDRPGDHLDIDATLHKTLQNGGWMVPVKGTRKAAPEYLALIDRASFKDHQAELIDTMLDQLVQEGVYISRYYFEHEPLLCYALDDDEHPLSLAELGERYPHHRLLLFAEDKSFYDSFSGESAVWTRHLHAWPQKALLGEVGQSLRQYLADNLDMQVMPATQAGLAAFAELVNSGAVFTGQRTDSQALPQWISEFPRRWLERQAPPEAEIKALLDNLRDWLDGSGFQWLCACAVYPEIHWPLTLGLGYEVKDEQGNCLFSEKRLQRLAVLPWLRYGYMPDWLRILLILNLPEYIKKQSQFFFYSWLMTSQQTLHEHSKILDIASNSLLISILIKLFLYRKVKKYRSENDYIFLSFYWTPMSIFLPHYVQKIIAHHSRGIFLIFAYTWLLLFSIKAILKFIYKKVVYNLISYRAYLLKKFKLYTAKKRKIILNERKVENKTIVIKTRHIKIEAETPSIAAAIIFIGNLIVWGALFIALIFG
jgi:hypothetical protein